MDWMDVKVLDLLRGRKLCGHTTPRAIKNSVYQQLSDGYTRDPMIPSPPFRFRARGSTPWTPEPYPVDT